VVNAGFLPYSNINCCKFMNLHRHVISALSLLFFGLATTLARANGPIELGSRLELFIDRFLIEEMQGVELRLHPPVKAPRPRSPLPEHHMMTVIKDGGKYRAWYRGKDPSYVGATHHGNAGETVHYAESRDGHEWDFPHLRMHDIGGSIENNVILADFAPFAATFMPFLDTRPGVSPDERYKAVAGYPGPGNKVGLDEPGRGLFVFASPDGIHWRNLGEAIRYRPEWRHAFDSPNVAFWSEAEQLYVCYFRTWTRPENLRGVSRATSPDFVNWSEPVELSPNQPGEHLYTTMTHPYVRAPHIYIALPTRFVPGRGSAPGYEQKDVNATDIMFMSKRAGSAEFDRTFMQGFIRPGIDPKQWINRANYVALNVVPTSPTELSIYHRSGDRYVLRTDGFASAHSGAKSGQLVTKLLTFAGAQLQLNLSTSAVGSVQIEMLDANGVVLATSHEQFGDEIGRTVTWRDRADVAEFAGKPVRLRFTLTDADLYSFRFRP
jgi:hypothetical protein